MTAIYFQACTSTTWHKLQVGTAYCKRGRIGSRVHADFQVFDVDEQVHASRGYREQLVQRGPLAGAA